MLCCAVPCYHRKLLLKSLLPCVYAMPCHAVAMQSKTGSVELRAKLSEYSRLQDFGKDEILTRMDKIVDFAKDRDM
jgi:hypothetical protein